MFSFSNSFWRLLATCALATSVCIIPSPAAIRHGTSQTGTSQTGTSQTGTSQTDTSQTGISQTCVPHTGHMTANTANCADTATNTVDATAFTVVKKNRYYYEKRGEAIWEVPGAKKAVAMTFDDGPNPKFTPKLLTLLREYQAHATFFLIGSRVAEYPELVRQELADGHELANHTYHHHNIKEMSQEDLAEEIEQTQKIINRVTGYTPVLFRPPTGFYSPLVIGAAKANHCLVVIWSWDQDTRDWGNADAQTISKQVLEHIHNGDIILFHDKAGDRTETLRALRTILPNLREQGYTFLTVSELLRAQRQAPRDEILK